MADFEGQVDEIRTDFDDKIIGGEVKKMLSQHQVKILLRHLTTKTKMDSSSAIGKQSSP